MHSHASTWHDGGVAVVTTDGEIVALASERVGDRYKHQWNSGLAYRHLGEIDRYAGSFNGDHDYHIDNSTGLVASDHHFYHAASTFFGSGYDEAAVLVLDGQGELDGHLATTTIWHGTGSDLRLVEELNPSSGLFAAESIGHFYTAVGALAGIRELYAEGKTMALAAYGRPSPLLDLLRRYASTKADGTYSVAPRFVRAVLANTLGREFFGWESVTPEDQAVWDEFVAARGGPPGDARHAVTQADMDMAYAGQTILEEIVLGLAVRAGRLTGATRLCLAGGVALNCVANGRVARHAGFDQVFVVPAPGDDGQAIGKVLVEIKRLGLPVDTTMHTAYYGPEYPASMVGEALHAVRSRVRFSRLDQDALLAEVVDRLDRGEVIGWYRGRSELGPRALGHRSILADPRRPDMRDHVNSAIKDREWFRPLAPMVVQERVGEFFELDQPSPFMTFAVPVRPEQRAVIPAVTHVDGTARVQTVSREQDEVCHRLLCRFAERTGVPVLLNTSFNRRDEPLVETPADALMSFLAMPLDALVIEDHLVTKRATGDRG
ncbi:MAG: carbamoyltransferase C-terminal domain-containing protein [Actinophytocola sp.]|uniref:carbamoyltransferase family protein n=1 Tax=Actinophytocola sp. TaxID=1872138 RepID=UPI003C762938